MKRFITIFLSTFILMACLKEDRLVGQSIQIVVGNRTFTATLYDNPTAKAFVALLPMTITMDELNDNEKYAYLPHSLPTAASNPGTIRNGDLMLFGSTCLVLFYKGLSSSYSYTKIGSIDDSSGLDTALGGSAVRVTFQTNVATSIDSTRSDAPSFRIHYPIEREIRVDGAVEKLKLSDLSGKIIAQSDCSPLSVGTLRSGVYILQIESGNKLYSHKITHK